jgi:hypothetical protein
MSFAIDLDRMGPFPRPDRAFGPVTAIVLGVLVMMVAMVAAAIAPILIHATFNAIACAGLF